MTTMNRVEFKTREALGCIHEYTFDGDNVVESHDIMTFPVAAWTDKNVMREVAITLALNTNRW